MGRGQGEGIGGEVCPLKCVENPSLDSGWGVLIQLSHAGAEVKRGMTMSWSFLQLFNNTVMKVKPFIVLSGKLEVIVFKALTTITINYKS